MERYDFQTQRLFVTADMAEGRPIDADRAQANYLLNVLRLKQGDKILLFNGRDGEWLAGIDPQGRKSCSLLPLKLTRAQPAPSNLHYCFAPLKHGRLEYMVQKAVEMGAGILQPVITQHTQISRLNTGKMQAHAIEAAEQCGILAIPQVRAEVPMAKLIADWEATRQLVYCDEAAPDADPVELLKPLKGKPLGLLVGPEGGFSADERTMLRQLPFVTVIPLGPRILRADTAAVAALAIVQAAAGDWVAV